MKKTGTFARRGFLGAGLVALGGGLGWVARRLHSYRDSAATALVPTHSNTVYDVSEYETTDPSLLLYQPAGEFATGFDHVKRLAVANTGQLMVAGDRSIRFFTPTGAPGNEVRLDRPPHCMQLLGNDLLVGLGNYFAVLDLDGKEKLRSKQLGEKAFLTAIAAHENTIYLADAGSREVLMANRETGAVFDRFGKKSETNPGFAVPSPYFDLAVAPDNRLRIANPGKLRVETYSLDGRFESSWGQPGLKIDRFCGCCNPVYFTLTPDGGFMTSEKGLTRVNLYDPHGTFLGAVAGPEVLVDDKQLAKRACQDCSVGAGFDVALDPDGTVLILDPFRKSVRRFVPKAAS